MRVTLAQDACQSPREKDLAPQGREIGQGKGERGLIAAPDVLNALWCVLPHDNATIPVQEDGRKHP